MELNLVVMLLFAVRLLGRSIIASGVAVNFTAVPTIGSSFAFIDFFLMTVVLPNPFILNQLIKDSFDP